MPVDRCPCCLSRRFRQKEVLWPELIEEWGLTPDEVDYINRQQGYACRRCNANIRSMALGRSIAGRMPLGFWILTHPWVKVLKINTAGGLTKFLRRMPRHVLTTFPEVDMMDLPYDDGTFDLVVHSDTLEHIPDAVQGLSECRRVLKPGGRLCFTVPILVDKVTKSREGEPPSYHGVVDRDYLVHREYGVDVWKDPIAAGFTTCTLETLDYPAGIAITATV